MKLRNDFISNSSSTNFIFGFKGNSIEDLTKAIRNHDCFDNLFAYDYIPEEEFKDKGNDLSEYKANKEDVIAAILKVFKEEPKYEWRKLVIHKTEELQNIINDHKFMIKEEYDDYVDTMFNKKIMYLEEMKKRGMSLFEIEFGDSHGHVSGKGLGFVMDYEGRGTELITDDLIIFTEQNR